MTFFRQFFVDFDDLYSFPIFMEFSTSFLKQNNSIPNHSCVLRYLFHPSKAHSMHRYVISGLDQNLLTNCLRVTQEEQPNGSITYFVNHCGADDATAEFNFHLGCFLQTIGYCIGARHQLFSANIFSLNKNE